MPDLERQAVLDWLRLAEPATTSLGAGLVRPIEVAETVEPLLVGLGQQLDGYSDPPSAVSLLAAGDLAPPGFRRQAAGHHHDLFVVEYRAQ